MIVKDITKSLEDLAPLAYAEDFDNVGLLVGDNQQEVTGVLVSLDTLEVTVDEAIENKCNLIVAFHPIIFGGLKSLTGKSYVERVVIKAIQHNIAIYAIHTALDNCFKGVNDMICEQLNLHQRQVLIPQSKTIKKLTTYVPKKHTQKVLDALFAAGAGNIGNYDHCSFIQEGKGSFLPNNEANPVVGENGKLQIEEENQIHVTLATHVEKQVLSALKASHPYEEVAYEVSSLENTNQHIGIGMVGELENPMDESDFLAHIKTVFNTGVVRHSNRLGNKIKKVAVLGGSGAFGIQAAIASGADVYITADLKYHDFFKAEAKILLADVGHYESEQYTKNLLHSYLTKKFPNFAIVLSQKNTNPIQYS